jgi:hypothetical protein
MVIRYPTRTAGNIEFSVQEAAIKKIVVEGLAERTRNVICDGFDWHTAKRSRCGQREHYILRRFARTIMC